MSRLIGTLAIASLILTGASLWAIFNPGGLASRVTKIEQHKPTVGEACRIVERGGYHCRKPIEHGRTENRPHGHDSAYSGAAGGDASTGSSPPSQPGPPSTGGGSGGNQGGGNPPVGNPPTTPNPPPAPSPVVPPPNLPEPAQQAVDHACDVAPVQLPICP